MFNKPKLVRSLMILCVTVAFAIPALADTVKLKDGSIIKGRVISFGEGKFTILIGSGSRQRQMTFFADEVDTIEFDGVGPTAPRPSMTSYNDPAAAKSSGSTVIMVGQTPGVPTVITTPASTPKPATPAVNTSSNQTATQPTPAATPKPSPSSAPTTPSESKGVIINLKVLADNTSNGWSSSGYVLKKGQKVRITATGRASLGKGVMTTALGNKELVDEEKLMKDQPTGALIGVIGDDNDDFIFIGTSREFVAQRDGLLFLGVNEGNLNDNSGGFDVTIEIDPKN